MAASVRVNPAARRHSIPAAIQGAAGARRHARPRKTAASSPASARSACACLPSRKRRNIRSVSGWPSATKICSREPGIALSDATRAPAARRAWAARLSRTQPHSTTMVLPQREFPCESGLATKSRRMRSRSASGTNVQITGKLPAWNSARRHFRPAGSWRSDAPRRYEEVLMGPRRASNAGIRARND